ncbi:LacI family DNA-binding transcriptional regulator [Natronospirillum operosum]|uniref:LacI family DNA-binding transcriptional regulator n=1 Tax=Natronospirillum operosum TaxID=2759953 RepID=A0A4Z0WEI7_9GAMM|nr:LacI family DNA-binding transcriptional regulator [Natronospirillum operosum]TGG93546.1 LacI family DNA-binding transcriptional regulator [Natronospirillum operosum]
MPSIKDVARVAGVSDKTVSRVVNREPNVKPETFRRVEQAIQDLGYVPNRAARLVRSRKSQVLGILTDLVSVTPYSNDIVRGAQAWAHANGYTVIVVNTNGDDDTEKAAWRTFQEHSIEGVLYVTMYHRLINLQASDCPLPTVLVNCRSTADQSLISVTPDDYRGSQALTRHVLEQGHRRIGYIRLNPVLFGAEERYRAFQDVVREWGIPDASITTKIGMSGVVGQEIDHSYQVTQNMLQQDAPPTVIMCGNDEIALQAYLGALTLGHRIPDDVSIVGHDDFKTVSKALKPALTTAALPYYDLGFRASEALYGVISGEGATGSAGSVKMDCPMVRRESVRPLPDSQRSLADAGGNARHKD